MQVRYWYGRNFGKKRFRFSCRCEFRRGGSAIAFDLTKVRGHCDEFSWRAFGDFSREQRTKFGELRCHFFYTVPLVYLSVYRHAGGDNIIGSIVGSGVQSLCLSCYRQRDLSVIDLNAATYYSKVQNSP